MSDLPVLEVVDYSEKCVAVFAKSGSLATYRNILESNEGKWNFSLSYGDKRSPGCIWHKSQSAKVKKIVTEINEGKFKPSELSLVSFKQEDFVDRKSYLKLVTRMEAMEQDLALIKKYYISEMEPAKAAQSNQTDGEEEDSVEEKSAPHPRLIRSSKTKAK